MRILQNQQRYMKTIVHALLNWKKDILKEIEQNIFFQNSFSLMISKEMVM